MLNTKILFVTAMLLAVFASSPFLNAGFVEDALGANLKLMAQKHLKKILESG